VGSRLPIWFRDGGRDGVRGRVSFMVAYVKAHHRHNYAVETEMSSHYRVSSQSIAIRVLRERLFCKFRERDGDRGRIWCHVQRPHYCAEFNGMLTARRYFAYVQIAYKFCVGAMPPNLVRKLVGRN